MSKDSDIITRTLPAEWEDYDAILMAWPHADTDWAYMLKDVQHTVVDMVHAFVDDGIRVVMVTPCVDEARQAIGDYAADVVIYVEAPTNDTWARDFGVITCFNQVGDPVLCDFKFNGWGLKFAANHDNLITRRLVDIGLLKGWYDNNLSFVLEGGSIDSDGKGSILTTSECLMSANRNGSMTQTQIESYLIEKLGVERILWLNHGYLAGDDTDSHIDTLARFASEEIILYVKCDDEADEHYVQLNLMEQELKQLTTKNGNSYHLIGLPLPDPIYDAEGNRLPATYANFLITPRSVMLPVYGQTQKDLLAKQILEVAFPGRMVHTINCVSLIQQHGSLHCMTMQIPHGVLKI